MFIIDGIRNALTGLGGTRDKGASSKHFLMELTDAELLSAYASSWIAQQVVDIPADDATKKWRTWEGEKGDEVSDLETQFAVAGQIKRAMLRGRLLGGGAVLIGADTANPAEPMRVEAVGQGDLLYLTVLDRLDLSAGPIVDDLTDPLFNQPAYYTVHTSGVSERIHPSRLVMFRGIERPTRVLSGTGWGYSVLQAPIEAIRHMDGAMASASSLLAEAKIDILKIPNLSSQILDPNFEEALKNRLAMLQMTVGNQRKAIIDGEEEWDSHSYSFPGIGDMLDRFAQVCAGAADIPMTRLFGQSPGGMNSTGDSDLVNYYDQIASLQKNEISPASRILDRVLVRSALGDEPEDVKPKWRPIREMTEKEQSEIANKAADTVSKLALTQLYEDEGLAVAGAKLMAEAGVEGLGDEIAEERGNEV